ncbi:hypothetical protein TFLX_02283 [Thermoflexales bacterium]|nr:hypothetical protein TFLX_02283 [Thermoflexales bacterium]
MKRYTVYLQALDAALTPERVKACVERDILHGRAALYRTGKASQPAPDKILLEIASDLKPADVLRYFREREGNLGARVEQLRWGWPITSADRLMITGMVTDPYAAAQVQSTEDAAYTYSRWHLVRYLIRLAMDMTTLIVILLIIFTPFREYLFGEGRIAWLNCAWQYFIWIYVFLGGRLIPVPYVAYVRCAPNGLEIKYGFWSKPRCLAWSEISRLELQLLYSSLGQAVVHAQSTALKFTGAIEHIDQEATLVKTMIDRAALVFAEDGGIKLIYRRSDSSAA